MKVFLASTHWWLLLLILPLLYLAACAWLYAEQETMLYFPQYTRIDAAQTDFELERDGIRLRGWALHRELGAPVLYFGGNAEALQDRHGQLARLFPQRSVYLLAYRGYGASEGRPSEAALLGDALALYDHVRAAHPGQAISVIGTSLGSGVAAHVASQRPVAKLALVTPYDSLAAVAQAHFPVFPARWLLRDHYDSVARLRDYRGAILVVRAGRDSVIPPANTQVLIDSLKPAPQVLELPEADHNDATSEPVFERTLQAFL